MKEKFKWKTMETGKCEVIRERRNVLRITGVLTKASGYCQNKTVWPKGTGHRNAIRTEGRYFPVIVWSTAESRTTVGKARAADRAVLTMYLADCQLTADALRLLAYQIGILVQKKRARNRWTEKLLTKMHDRRQQGCLLSSCPKFVVPTTFESSVVK